MSRCAPRLPSTPCSLGFTRKKRSFASFTSLSGHTSYPGPDVRRRPDGGGLRPRGSRRYPTRGQRAGRSCGGASARGAVPRERVRDRRTGVSHHSQHGGRLARRRDCHRISRANWARPRPPWQCLRGRLSSGHVPGAGRSRAHAAERLLTGKSSAETEDLTDLTRIGSSLDTRAVSVS